MKVERFLLGEVAVKRPGHAVDVAAMRSPPQLWYITIFRKSDDLAISFRSC